MYHAAKHNVELHFSTLHNFPLILASDLSILSFMGLMITVTMSLRKMEISLKNKTKSVFIWHQIHKWLTSHASCGFYVSQRNPQVSERLDKFHRDTIESKMNANTFWKLLVTDDVNMLSFHSECVQIDPSRLTVILSQHISSAFYGAIWACVHGYNFQPIAIKSTMIISWNYITLHCITFIYIT